MAGTPTFIVNGKGSSGTKTLTQLKALGLRRARRASTAAPMARRRRTRRGPADSAPPRLRTSVEIVLYSDFQCPYCAQFAKPFRELQTKGARRRQGQGQVQELSAVDPSGGAAGAPGGAGGEGAGQVLGDARSAVRQPAACSAPI